MNFPHTIEYKIFDFKKESYLLFMPRVMCLFEIDAIVKDMFEKGENLQEEEIVPEISRKYGRESVKQAIKELKLTAEKGCFVPGREGFFRRLLRNTGFQRLELHIANDCNMNCAYCFAKGGSYDLEKCSKMMKWETARAALDWFLGQNKAKDTAVSIQFFGGEPLLNVEVLEKSLDYIQDRKDNGFDNFTHLIIGTNGTLLDDRSIDILKKHNCIPWISVDFSREDHDKNRVYKSGKGTYDDVVKGIKRLKARAPELPIVLCPTYERKENIYEIYKLKEELGAEQVNFKFNFALYHRNEVDDSDFYKILENCGRELNGVFKRCVSRGLPFEILPDYRFYHLHTGRNIYFGCGAGKNRIAVNTDGNIFMCSIGIGDFREIGDVSKGIYRESQDEIDRVYMEAAERHYACADCWARRLCNGICVSGRENTSVIYGENRGCDANRFLCELMLKSYATLRPEHLKRIYGGIETGAKEAVEKAALLYEVRELRNAGMRHIRYLTPVSELLAK